MTTWLPRVAGLDGPVYRAIVDQLADAIRRGTLKAGDRLPTHRLMADLLGINVSTVTRAYREAERRRLIGGEVGRGTFVLGGAAEARLFAFADRPQDSLIDLSTNTPPKLVGDDGLAKAVAALLEEGELERFADYPTPGDLHLHRLAAESWLVQHGVNCVAERIVLCAGAQHAMEAALAAAGATVVGCESLCWPGLKAIARSRGLRLHALPIDRDGILPDALERAALQGLKCLVCMPTLHNPTARTWSIERREAIVAVARRHDLMLIEEDVYGALMPISPTSLASLAPERVCHVSGLSKTVAPGLRLGYLVLPPALHGRQEALEHHTHWYVSPLGAEIARRWIVGGAAKGRLTRQRRELAARWKLTQAALADYELEGATVSPHLWLPLARGRDPQRVAEVARREGVAVVPSETFAAATHAEPAGLRVSLGAASSRSRLQEALSRLAPVLQRSALLR
ncbi:PLP-dependent aminotransferase family protein [Niveibacterium sp. COAC-50]|uniref:aminotransferase-like domain-containing protein n=1 Tax=Niveibacterium sp. COAC-50 TaxID=2729384 RepID=UPI00155274B4|nr:PLP-dependent aminotransferase family protein [Niveibacterium sp. COAC-50]